MKIAVLKKGDRVLSVNPEFISVERKNGEVDIIPLIRDETGLRIDTENITTIGYGNNIVSAVTDDGVEVINF